MSWLVDNANGIFILFAVVAAGFVVAWRFDGQVKYLSYAACALGLLALFWLLTLNVVTDRKQLEKNVHAMAGAVEKGQLDVLFKHISNDFRYRGLTRERLYDLAQQRIKEGAVRNIRISSFRVEELAREKKFARTSFLVAADAQRDVMFRTEADFALEGENWKLKTLRFYRLIGGQDQEIDLPGIQ